MSWLALGGIVALCVVLGIVIGGVLFLSVLASNWR